MMTIDTNSMLDEECGQEFFDSVTDEELIYLWRWIKGRGISANEACYLVVSFNSAGESSPTSKSLSARLTRELSRKSSQEGLSLPEHVSLLLHICRHVP